MTRYPFLRSQSLRVVLCILTLLFYASPASAILGVRRRTAVVAASAGAASANQANQAAQQGAAAESAAAASQASAAAAESAAAASKAAAEKAPAPAAKTPQQRLGDLQSMYKQGLITESEYNAAKAKILGELSQ